METKSEKPKLFKASSLVAIAKGKDARDRKKSGATDPMSAFVKLRSSQRYSWSMALTLVRFTLHIAVYSMIGTAAGFAMFWLPHLYGRDGTKGWRIELSRNHSLIVPHDGTQFADHVRSHFNWDFISFVYLPSMFHAVVGVGIRKTWPCWLLCLLFYASFFVARLTLHTDSLVTMVLGTSPGFAFVVGLHFLVLKRNLQVSLQFVRVLLVLPLGVVAVQILHLVDPSDEDNQLFLACVGYPFIREIFSFLCRRTARHQTLQGNPVEGLRFKRKYTWFLFTWLQMTMSIVGRLHFTRISDKAKLYFATFFQGILEITMRLSLPMRERLASFISRKLFGGSGASATVMPKTDAANAAPSDNILSRSLQVVGAKYDSAKAKYKVTFDDTGDSTRRFASNETEIDLARKSFISMLLIGESLSEFMGIFTAATLLVVARPVMLYLPLDYYNNLEHPFTEPLDLNPIYEWVALQVSSELLVDFISGMVEVRNGYNLPEIWSGRHRWFFLGFAWSAAFATACSFLFLGFRDFLNSCTGDDLCYCADGNGLQIGGLKERFWCVATLGETKRGDGNGTECIEMK